MFRVVTKDPKLLRDSIEIISQIIDDGIFKLKKSGIEMLASDRAMISVVDFKLKSSAFEEYESDEEKSIGINLLNLLTVLKRAESDDKLTMSLNEKENKLEIGLEGRSNRKFSIPLLEIKDEEIPPIHQLNFSALAEVKSDILNQGINDADIIADSVMIELSDNSLRMFSEGNSSKSELNLRKDDESLINLDVKEKVKSRYSLDYLKKMIKAAKIAENTKIQIGNDYPLKMQFVGDHASFTLILAPRVSEE